jgi:hypothetical protein
MTHLRLSRSALKTTVIGGLLLGCSALYAEPMIGIVGNEIVYFDSAAPATIIARRAMSNVPAGETIVGVDLRPATNALYGFTSGGRVVTIDFASGNVSTISTTTTAFTGTSFGVGFNPVPDRLRVVTDTNENVRFNPDTGAVAGTDTALTPTTVDIVGVAYDRSVAGATLTTMFVIDSAGDQLGTQGGVDGTPSPNGGVINPIGPLGVDTSSQVSFDISGTNGAAVASLTVGGVTGLYNINLATGAATSIGIFPANAQVSAVAFVPALVAAGPAVPVPSLNWLGLSALIAGLVMIVVISTRK